jgi:hypothetical protein
MMAVGRFDAVDGSLAVSTVSLEKVVPRLSGGLKGKGKR